MQTSTGPEFSLQSWVCMFAFYIKMVIFSVTSAVHSRDYSPAGVKEHDKHHTGANLS